MEQVSKKMRCIVKEMPRKHKVIWSGRLGEIRRATHRVKLVAEAITVHSHTNISGPKSREYELTKVKRMLGAGVIEPTRAG